ncbi:MAG: amino acid adenylation domain-containing protein, partial [Chloroflexi bacterium]|nr:amino acid adenylation domain-containing protein [Chloroflexota bacterium]
GNEVPARSRAGTESLIGPFENLQPLHVDLSGNPSFAQLFERMRQTMQEAQTHEDLPFELLLKEVPNSRTLGRNLLVRAMLRLPLTQPPLPDGWRLTYLEEGTGTAQFDLALELQDSVQGLLARFIYRTDLFEESTIARLAGHWQTLLESIVADIRQPLARVSLLTVQERSQLLEEWTATEKPYPQHGIAQLFEAQVARRPEAIAVICEEEQISYQELNRQANQLAHLLRANGVGPETLVALLAERGIPFVVAVLAVFKAGGAYVPLDPYHPPVRLRRVIEQSHCKLVLTTKAFVATALGVLEDLSSDEAPGCIYLESVPQTSQPEENLPDSSGPGDLAYVIYTSGSTGQPKGAMVEQRGKLNHLFAKIEALTLSESDTVAQTASQCFDISVWQFLAALLVGGSVRIYPDVVAHDAMELLRQVQEHGVSILETVPSLLSAMLDAQQPEKLNLPALRWLIPTGEALPVELCRRWLERYPHVPLLNAYGPTECSDDVTHYVISQPPQGTSRSVPIGKAIPNMRLYVLDKHLEPLPVGVSGELYVGGIGVGRGYLGDEQRTAEAFVADPFSSEEGARLYKTGDRARYLPDGNLEFLGRLDYQVKVRGYRIELGEIEAVLSQQAGVRQAVVVVREDEPGEQRLVAYVVLDQQRVTVEDLKSWLMRQVPNYMVPAAFVVLEQLPLTANGKLNRKALPVPERSRSEGQRYVAPQEPLHRQLVEIWEDVLGAHPIGIRDDFFELGGDSLLAVRLFERIRQECGKRLSLSTLFAGATIEHVAGLLQEEESKQEEPGTQGRAALVVVQKGGSRRPFFYLHGEWRGVALYSRELAHRLGEEQPFYLLEPYDFDGLAVPPTFEEMAAAHLEVVRRVQPEGPYLLGGWCNGGLMAYEMARQLHAQGQTVELLVLMDPDAPARHRWVHRTINLVGNLLRISEEKQFEGFLYLQHIYRYVRFSRYRRAKNAELLDSVEPGEAGRKPGNGGSMPLSLRLKALVPKVETLRLEYLNMYDWPASDYAPDLYPDKITFFWTSEEPWRLVGWQKVVKAKESEVEMHVLPGNHITCRTEHLPVLAEHLRTCLSKAQMPVLH